RSPGGAPPPPDTGDVLQAVALSPDGTRAYTGDRHGVVREWDTARGVDLRARAFRGWLIDVALSADGARLAATGPDGSVWVLDARTFDVVLELNLAGAYGNGVAFAPKRPYLMASDGDGNVRCWHRDTGQPVGVPLRLGGAVTYPRFRPNSDQFAVGAGSTVHLCELPDPSGDVLSVGGTGGRVRGLCFAPDGRRLAVTDELTFDLFDPRSGARLHSVPDLAHAALSMCHDADPARPGVFRGHREGFNRLAIPNGREAVKVPTSQPLGRVYRIESLPGGLYVMGSSVVVRYDPVALVPRAARQPAAVLPSGVTLGAMAVRPDAGEVFVSFANRAFVLKGDTLEPLRAWDVGDEVLDARYTPDGKSVLVGRRDSVAELLDAATGTPTPVPPMPHARAVVAVAVSPDGALFLTGSRDGTARFWDAKTGLPMGGPMRHAGPVTHVAFSPKGDHIATGTGTGTVVIWDLPPAPSAALLAKWAK
ncbi:MAG: WD40 repeat domain-containing protein, partial [Planctomycetes bacterium]|nr:WD40 repeat domain-containing protein [Planctomycetota bacterium]